MQYHFYTQNKESWSDIMDEKQQDLKRHQWNPITFDYLLESFSLANIRVLGALLFLIVVIVVALWGTLEMIPQNWVALGEGERGFRIIQFFLFNPALILGMLLFFWFGFEWGFIPVFLSSFMIALSSGLEWYWSLVFGLSFVLGITICAIAYRAFQVSYNLRSFNSVVFFISIMFIGSISSSLGAFIWSFAQDLTAYKTVVIWKSWWSGSFLQALIIIAPIIYLGSPFIERLKNRLFNNRDFTEVSRKWVFGSVSSITGALILFILSGRYLGRLSVKEVMRGGEVASVADVISALGSFELIIWISIGIIVVTGFGAFVLLSGWNKQLREEVDSRTQKLKESQDKLENSLEEKKTLLEEIHHRIKNNLGVISGILELQKYEPVESVEELIEDTQSRIRSIATIHEKLYQSKTLSDVEMSEYIEDFSEAVLASFNSAQKNITITKDLQQYNLDAKKTVPLGLIVNELLSNAYKHGVSGIDDGEIKINLEVHKKEVVLTVADNGNPLPDDFSIEDSESMGMSLVKTLTKQLDGTYHIKQNEWTTFEVRFPTVIPKMSEK